MRNCLFAITFLAIPTFAMKSMRPLVRGAVFAVAVLVPCTASLLASPVPYKNPILWADYSDPDVIRVGNTYYMVASSFHFMPGIPILESVDLVHWSQIGHVYPRLDIDPRYNLENGNRYGGGAWAPAIRFHKGRFYVYFPTPDEGIFVSNAKRITGPWTTPEVVIKGHGYEDPCPFWDDDGNAYLVHSKLGAGPLILHRMSADGLHVLDEGRVIMNDPKKLPTLEGPKFYKRNGYYYIFAPYGGVSTGSQAVLRSKNIWGPYDVHTVLRQGSTDINGPHQGGYVETQDGAGWFLHFHSQGAYGRITFLEPVQWKEDWPVVGARIDDTEAGQPVPSGMVKSPRAGSGVPAASDEFSGSKLSPQWEWNHNPDDSKWSLKERPGYLRLHATPATDLLHARNTLTELGQDRDYTFTVAVDLSGLTKHQSAGVVMFCEKPVGLQIEEDDKGQITIRSTESPDKTPLRKQRLWIRLTVRDAEVSSSWSDDEGQTFQQATAPALFSFSWWKAARPAIFSFSSENKSVGSAYLDVDWVHYEPLSH